MKLVIVESPAKAKTIAKYLGNEYEVDASGGHVSDLPEKELGVDVKNGYQPTYIVTESKKETIKRLSSKIKKADTVYLATDPDREGEAISWHLQQVLKLDGSLENRIVFNEITKKAVQEAIKQPRRVNMDLVNAQQARRVLDRLVGYKLSPVLSRKIKPRLSGGRVQSAALKIIVDREKEIQAFKPEEYWTVNAFLFKDQYKDIVFRATLADKNGKKYKIKNGEECQKALSEINQGSFSVRSVKKAKAKSNPHPPFTTSTLQQDAGSKLGLSSKVTMQIAQKLYEGMDIPEMGHIALVTYIRTDSVRISDDAKKAAKEYLLEHFGEKYIPAKYNVYKSKKDAQDAHEAIRPVNLEITPESLTGKIEKNYQRVYKLIYDRFLASQSTPAEFDTLTVVSDCSGYGFKSTGRTMLFDGYLRIYGEEKKEAKEEDGENAKMPPLEEGDALSLKELKHEQKFTKPPQRYTESSIVKTMEENGIGRPSTYATILNVLYSRKYAELDKKSIVPTELGITVTDYLDKYFNDIVDVEFTAQMEGKLDAVEESGLDWITVVDEFYKPFIEKVKSADKISEKVYMEPELSDEVCEKCGSRMYIKEGRYGKYLECEKFPECDNRKSLKKRDDAVVTDIMCEKCGRPMLERTGKYGKYLACSGFPECENIRSQREEPKPTGETCEKCGRPMVERIGKYGKFLSCSGYPECKNIKNIKSDAQPAVTNAVCEKCGKPMVEKMGRYGKFLSCSGYPECRNIVNIKQPKPTTQNESSNEALPSVGSESLEGIPSVEIKAAEALGKCPDCGAELVMVSYDGTALKNCTNPECGYSVKAED